MEANVSALPTLGTNVHTRAPALFGYRAGGLLAVAIGFRTEPFGPSGVRQQPHLTPELRTSAHAMSPSR